MDLVATAAEQYGDNTALITAKETLSFRGLDATTARIANVLLHHGIQRESVVALCMPNSPEMILLLLALLRMESVAAPLNYRFPPSRLQTFLQPLKPATLIGPKDLTDKLSAQLKLDPENIFAESTVEKPIFRHTEKTRQFNTFVSIIHTSSSSGNPKAALHSLGNHYHSAMGSNENLPFGPGDCWLLSLPLFHIGGYAMLFRSLLGGGALAVTEPGTPIRDALVRFQLSHLSLVPTQLFRVMHDKQALKHLQNLKAILLGGSTIEPALLAKALTAKLPVYLSYGSTEMSSQITTTSSPAGTITAGKPLLYRELSIGPGDEILVKGPCLFQGYLSEKGPVLETDGSGWFHTGDTGILSPEGELRVTGRTDNMFISGGENIHPEEIERALCSLTGVLRAVAVPTPDPEYGLRPSAFIETSENTLTDSEIKDTLSRAIGKLKTPVTITRIEDWRLLPGTEKIDRGYYKRKVDG